MKAKLKGIFGTTEQENALTIKETDYEEHVRQLQNWTTNEININLRILTITLDYKFIIEVR